MPEDLLPQSVRVSRRHLLKAIAIVTGALSASLSKTARAQQNWEEGGGSVFGSNNQGGNGQGGNGQGGNGQGGNGQGGDCQDGDSQGHGHCCFLRGTLVRAAGGYRPIETLAAGDLVPTRFSGMAPIRKIISFTTFRDETGRWPEECRLVRISAGAFDDGVPARDLFVTHTHEVFLNRVLMPIASLVNGRTVSFHNEIGFDNAEYFHLEFEHHDVIDAEGALCESSRDETMERCAPVALNGGRSRLWSHLRNAAAPLVDRRQPFDSIQDRLESRAGLRAIGSVAAE